ncbi:conserved hypothetical protein [Vibrio coralliirubri]|uniref:hypothetical protein n=1 Tax=Vibrio coralliirubri TaxID=1516159 RepID=UPI0006379F00|nr:hypothetical protein [Vibrio coralliirubri]CDU05636.1 conserved hypothetical protein [Vibrio coralliirubri]
MSVFFLNIVLSILSGIYAGLVVARFVKFEEIRSQVKKAIHEIDYMNEGVNGEYVIINQEDCGDLSLYYSDLLYLRHTSAAEIVGNLITAINHTKHTGHQSTGDVSDFHVRWQGLVRKMSPNIWVLLSLRLKV